MSGRTNINSGIEPVDRRWSPSAIIRNNTYSSISDWDPRASAVPAVKTPTVPVVTSPYSLAQSGTSSSVSGITTPVPTLTAPKPAIPTGTYSLAGLGTSSSISSVTAPPDAVLGRGPASEANNYHGLGKTSMSHPDYEMNYPNNAPQLSDHNITPQSQVYPTDYENRLNAQEGFGGFSQDGTYDPNMTQNTSTSWSGSNWNPSNWTGAGIAQGVGLAASIGGTAAALQSARAAEGNLELNKQKFAASQAERAASVLDTRRIRESRMLANSGMSGDRAWEQAQRTIV